MIFAMQFQPSLAVRPGSHFAIAGSSDNAQIVELHANGHLFVSSLSASVDAGNKERAEPVDVGQVIGDEEPKALGMLCSGEHIVIWHTSGIKVLICCNTFRHSANPALCFQILRLSAGEVDVVHSTDSKSPIDEVALLSAGRLAVVSKVRLHAKKGLAED